MKRRREVTRDDIEQTMAEFAHHLRVQIAKHGIDCFIGPHETKGVLDEEVDEFHEAVHKNKPKKFKAELLDVAVAALFGVASQKVWHREGKFTK